MKDNKSPNKTVPLNENSAYKQLYLRGAYLSLAALILLFAAGFVLLKINNGTMLLIVAAFILLLQGACFLLLIKKHVFAPLNQLAKSLEKLKLEKIGEIYGLNRNDSIGALAQEVQSLNEQNKKLEKELEETVNALKKAGVSKAEFVANMSHEIRSPLNTITGMAKLALDSSDAKQMHHYVNQIESAAANLLDAVNDVMDISKIESGKMSLYLSDFNFKKMLQNIIAIVTMRIKSKNQELIVDYDDDIPTYIVADEHRLSQVIANLLTNASKFTPEGGTIKLSAKLAEIAESKYMLEIAVSDTGVGIAPEKQARLFRSIEQFGSSQKLSTGGSGLGLSINRQIVKLMGGNIWVESEEGKGSRFAFTACVEKGFGGPKSIGESEILAMPDIDTEHAALRLSGKRILLAEDIEVNREILIALLEDTKVIIDCAENGLEAVEMFGAEPDKYDLILMDIQMPELDGLSATRRIRSMGFQKAKNIPIIAMTASVMQEDIEKCRAAGMNAHIGKPLDINDVLIKLQSYLSN